jgi:hypothetical protein
MAGATRLNACTDTDQKLELAPAKQEGKQHFRSEFDADPTVEEAPIKAIG